MGRKFAITAVMCGRYRLSRRKHLVEEYFEAVSEECEWNSRYNVAPSQPVLTIRQDTLSHEIGTGAVLGEGPEHRVQNNKREIRDGRHNSQCREPFKSQRCLVNSFGFTKSD